MIPGTESGLGPNIPSEKWDDGKNSIWLRKRQIFFFDRSSGGPTAVGIGQNQGVCVCVIIFG